MNVYMLLDRSGSMSSLMDEALGSINGYVGKLDPETNVVLAIFDDTSYDVIRNTKASDWTSVTISEATPRGMTPLYDSAGKLLTRAFEDNPDRAFIVMMTDGHENCSKEYTNETIKARLKNAEERDWEVVFLGANFDQVGSSASNLGFSSGKFMNIAKGNLGFEMADLATRTVMYASTGARVEYTEADKMRAAKK